MGFRQQKKRINKKMKSRQEKDVTYKITQIYISLQDCNIQNPLFLRYLRQLQRVHKHNPYKKED